MFHCLFVSLLNQAKQPLCVHSLLLGCAGPLLCFCLVSHENHKNQMVGIPVLPFPCFSLTISPLPRPLPLPFSPFSLPFLHIFQSPSLCAIEPFCFFVDFGREEEKAVRFSQPASIRWLPYPSSQRSLYPCFFAKLWNSKSRLVSVILTSRSHYLLLPFHTRYFTLCTICLPDSN